MEHPQTVILSKVLQLNIALGNSHVNNLDRSKTVNRWMDLQQSLNVLFDSKTATGQAERELASGIYQLMEKREGIFLQKMMGKRVNFACRSVISPDPYLAVNEIGIPPYFALRLTYREILAAWNVGNLRDAIINGSEIHPWNVGNLRDAIINGSEIHPGATHYVVKLSTVKLPPSKKTCISISRKLPSSRGVVTRYGKSCDSEFEGKTVYRHLRDGDVVLVNRQDHIVSAVLLTMKDTFLTQVEFNQLLYGSGLFGAACGSPSAKPSGNISTIYSDNMMLPILPAVWKSKPLWTRKQVITELLNNLTRDYTLFTVEKDGKIPSSYFGSLAGQSQPSKDGQNEDNGEHRLLIRKNELVHGVMDEAHFRKYGLVHTVQELYGSNTAGILLSALSRLFTVFLQINGFTCGVDDLLILPRNEEERKKELEGEDW